MTDRHCCPLCTETYDERTDLRVHLEVSHRKSEVVSLLVDLYEGDLEGPIEDDRPIAGATQSTPSAD